MPDMFANNDRQNRGPEGAAKENTSDTGLVSFVMTRVQRGRQVRDTKYAKRWTEYTRLWRGFWAEEDKNQNSERSKLISPALQQAIEMSTAEIEEAVFSRTAWLDIDDDIADEEKEDATAYRDQLLEDFEFAGVEDSIARAFLLGAIYGTGIAKLNVVLKDEKLLTPSGPVTDERVVVSVEAIRPDEFVIDPSATTIDEALYCAHEMIKPLHTIVAKQKAGVYKYDEELAPWSGKRGDTTGTGLTATVDQQDDGVLITEYYGKVPGRYIGKGPGLHEAIVVIANEACLLKAMANPFHMEDRPVVAFQFDTVPGEFWGRGVAEKGFNPQKALDAELRARMDALALVTAPMLGADITRMPRNPDMRVRPGKIFMTRGRPSEIIEKVGFDAAGLAFTFQQAGDLERMVQMGTGSMDSAAPLSTNRRNETMGGMSMLNAGFLKRSKRTMQNIERQFLSPLVKRALWRYMQFDPDRYQTDMTFRVRTAMGMMAKEVELGTLTQVLGYVPPESPAHKILLAAVMANTASAEKDELKKAIDAMLAPPGEEEVAQQKQQAEMQTAMMQATLQKEQADAMLAQANAQLAQAKTKRELVLADLEDDKVEIQAANSAIAAEQVRVSRGQMIASHKKVEVDREKAKQRPSSK
jgi:hypothetical protein